MKPVPFEDFSGGITDKDVPGETNRYEVCDNLLIEGDRRLEQRDGFNIYSSTAYQLDASVRASRMVNFKNDSEIVFFQNKKAWHQATALTGAWAEVTGPGGDAATTKAFNNDDAAKIVEYDQWQGHLFAASSHAPSGLTFTVTIASPCVFTSNAHGFSNGDAVTLTTTGALPLCFSAGKTYYIVNKATNTFELASAPAGGSLGTTYGTQSGTHKVYAKADPVIKIYRDSLGTMRLRSAGMPEVPDTQYPVDGGLADAITLANDIRTQMISHFGSNGATAGTVETLSTRSHTAGTGELASQASDASGTTAATTLASLITLVNSLRALYSRHIGDAQKNQPHSLSSAISSVRDYHVKPSASTDYYRLHDCPNNDDVQVNYAWFHFLNFSLEEVDYDLSGSATIEDVLPLLNELRDKWNWHNYATNTHFNAWRYRGSESFTNLGAHATSYARVETYTWAKFGKAYAPFSQYVQDLKTEFDYHRTGGAHHQSDSVTAIPSGVDSTPDDLWECVTLLGWLAHSITLHAGDAVQSSYQLTCDSTSASAILATAEAAPATNALRDFWCIPLIGTTSGTTQWALDFTRMTRGSSYRCTANTAATSITCASNFGTTDTGREYLFTASQWHLGGTQLSPATQGLGGQELSDNFNELDFTFPSAATLTALADYAEDVADLLKNHELQNLTEFVAEDVEYWGKYSVYSGNRYSRWLPSGRDSTGNVLESALAIAPGWPVHYHLTTEQPLGSSRIGASFFPSSAANSSELKEDHFADRKPVGATFNYKMLFRYDYTVGTKSFTDRGKPSSAINVLGFENFPISESGASEMGRHSVALTNIYQFRNSTNENWDTADTTNFKKEIYRTTNGGQRYYRVDYDGSGGSLTNAEVGLSTEKTVDDYLVNQLALYTNSGAPANGRPPTGTTSVHVFKNVMYYVVGNRVYQSIPNDLDSVPATFYEEFEEDIVCVSSTKNVAVALGTSKIYRLIGGFDDAGRGALTYDPIFDRTGVISQTAVVKADDAVFFAGKDGFYVTDGFKCFRVTDLEDTFISYTDTAAKRARIQGTYDNISKRIYWTFQTAAGSNPDKIWVLDLQFGIKPDAVPVTTLSKTSGFNPTALSFFGGQLYYGDGDGYVWVQTRGRNIDLVKDTGVAATSWAAEAVRWNFKSCHSHYGEPRIRKYFTSIGVQFEQQSTNVSCQITSDADKGRIESELPVIRSRKLVDWEGDSNGKLDWISTVYPAKAGNLVDEWRWFKGDGSLRSNFRAIELALAYCVIVKSTDMGTVTVANIAGNVYSVTLTSLSATRKWPLYSVGYFIRINSVDYPVTVRTSDTVVRIDSTGLTSPTQTVHTSWEMWGYPKNERVRLLGYTVNVDAGGDNQTASQGPVVSGGRNA